MPAKRRGKETEGSSELLMRPTGRIFSLGAIVYTCPDMQERRARKNYVEKDLAGAELEEILFETCSFVATDLTDTRLVEVTFEGCKLVGVDFRRCCAFPAIDMQFFNCVLDGCNFSDLSLKRQKFVSCDLRRCVFLRADLSEADFSHSDLDESIFHECDLRRTDFSRARNYLVDPNGNKIAGAKFSLPEAISLLRGFEIELR